MRIDIDFKIGSDDFQIEPKEIGSLYKCRQNGSRQKQREEDMWHIRADGDIWEVPDHPVHTDLSPVVVHYDG